MSKKSIEKPDWFELKNYDACKNFNGINWLLELQTRKIILNALEKDKNGAGNSYYQAHIKNTFGLNFPNHLQTDYLNRIGYNEENYTQAIDDGNITKGVSEVISNDLSIKGDEKIKTLRIDLNEKDTTLKNNFKDWLNAKRDNEKIKHSKTITLNTFKNWSKWNILGMYDLLLWAKYKGYYYGKQGNIEIIDLFAFLHPNDTEHFKYYGEQANREIGKINNKNVLEMLYKEILFNKL